MGENQEIPVDQQDDAADEEFIDVELAECFSRDDRAMIRTLNQVIEFAIKAREAVTVARVGYAIDDMIIAACERVGRICRSDSTNPPDCDDSQG